MSRAMRIGLRVRANPAWRGGMNYVANWARACATLSGGDRPEVFLLCADDASRLVAEELRPYVAEIRAFREARLLDLDLVYPVTQIFEAPFDCPWAGWIPDWQCQHLPEMFDVHEHARRRLHYGLLATRAPLLAFSSEMAEADTLRLFGARTVPHARLPFPAVLTAEERGAEAPREQFDVPERYFLICNQWWRHKNHALVLEALARIRDLPVVCVFTGEPVDPRWPAHFDEMMRLIEGHRLSDRVRILGSVPRQAQIGLMRDAVAVIQPSLFEGWSTIVEEARALGAPLLLSRFPVHLEQAPPQARFFAPDSPDELAELMRSTWRSPPPRASADGHAAYVRECALRLVQLAARARQAYRPGEHDPKVIMRDILCDDASIADAADPAVQARLRERLIAGCRAALRADPAQLAAFQRLCSDARLQKDIVLPSLAALGEVERHEFTAAGGIGEAPVRSRLAAFLRRLRARG